MLLCSRCSSQDLRHGSSTRCRQSQSSCVYDETLVCAANLTSVASLPCRVTIKMVLSVTVAVLVARTLLQSAARTLAKHATDELYQLTVIAFCLVGAWISGYLVRMQPRHRIPPPGCCDIPVAFCHWQRTDAGSL